MNANKAAHKRGCRMEESSHMRKRKGNLLQRTMALLLSAALIAGMALEAVPLTVLAQENVGGGINVVNLSRKSANYKFTRMKKPFVIP